MGDLKLVVGRYGELWDRVRVNPDEDFDEYETVDSPVLRTHRHRFNQLKNGLILTDEGQIYNADIDNVLFPKKGFSAVVESKYEGDNLIWFKWEDKLASGTYNDNVVGHLMASNWSCGALLYTLDGKVLININNQWVIGLTMGRQLAHYTQRLNMPKIEDVTEVSDRFVLTEGYIHVAIYNRNFEVLSIELEDDCFLTGIGKFTGVDGDTHYYLIMICNVDYRRVVIELLERGGTRFTVRNILLNNHINNSYPLAFANFDDNDCLVCSDGTVLSIDKDGNANTLPIHPDIFRNRDMKSARTGMAPRY